MTYTKKSEILASQADTSVGAVGNTTSVPGWKDVFGSCWSVVSGAVKPNSSTDTKELSNEYLNAHYTESGEGNQRLIFEIPAGTTTVRRDIKFRHKVVGATNQYIRCYFPLSGLVYLSWNDGTGEPSVTSGSTGLNNAKRYRITMQVSGTIAGGGILFSLTIYNVTDAAPHIWNSGSATYNYTITSNAPESGTIFFEDDNATGTFGLPLEVWTEGSAALTAPTIAASVTSTTTSIAITPQGGVAPMTIAVRRAGNHITGSPGTFTSTALTFTESGLTQRRHYLYDYTITDALSQTYSSQINLFTRQTIWPTTVRVLGVGDSITVGGTPRPTETARDLIANVLGVTSSSVIDECCVAQTGYTSGQIASLASEIVQVANGGAAGANTVGGNLNGNASVIFIRLGKNDSSSTPAQTKASVKTVIDAIRAGCSSNPVIVILPITGYQGSGADNTSMDADRQYACNIAFRDLDDPTNLVYVANLIDWYQFASTPAYLPDSVHPQQAQMSSLGQSMANCYLQRYVLSGNADWAAGTGGTKASIFGF